MAAILVIGGGAAGFFAAIHAAHKNNKVVIFEKSGKVLSKVKISGGGRCNVTNTLTEISLLIANYPRGRKELRNVFFKIFNIGYC
jgi:predicted flavoprotein YhiN